MAKEKPTSHQDYEVHDAMHTILRAAKVLRDKPLMVQVRKHAQKHAEKMKDESHMADQLAKRGHISPKAMAKMKRG